MTELKRLYTMLWVTLCKCWRRYSTCIIYLSDSAFQFSVILQVTTSHHADVCLVLCCYCCCSVFFNPSFVAECVCRNAAFCWSSLLQSMCPWHCVFLVVDVSYVRDALPLTNVVVLCPWCCVVLIVDSYVREVLPLTNMVVLCPWHCVVLVVDN